MSAPKSGKGLYVVWSPDGEAPPKVAHDSHKSACFAAWRLAKQHPGHKFFVMGRAGKHALVEMQPVTQEAQSS